MDKQAKVAEGARQSGFPFFNGFSGQAMRFALWPMEMWLQWQADVLKAAAPVTAEWLARRREGTESALGALQRLCACEDAEGAAKVQSDWVSSETKRLESDLRCLSGSALFWSRDAVKPAQQSRRPDQAA